MDTIIYPLSMLGDTSAKALSALTASTSRNESHLPLLACMSEADETRATPSVEDRSHWWIRRLVFCALRSMPLQRPITAAGSARTRPGVVAAPVHLATTVC